MVIALRGIERPNKRFEPDSLRRRFAPPPLAAQAIRSASKSG